MKDGKPKGQRQRPADERSPIDGRTVQDRRRIVAELTVKGLEQVAGDDDPEMRKIRDKYAKQLSQAYAKQMDASAQRKTAAKQERSSRKSPMRAKILEVMRDARAAHRFADFLAAWLATSFDELQIQQDGDRYTIEDTQAGGEATYTRRALLNLWTAAGK